MVISDINRRSICAVQIADIHKHLTQQEMREGTMGTEISLDIGGSMVTYAKNAIGMDHGPLFQESDRRPLKAEQIDYEYFAEAEEDPTRMEMAFSRPLNDVAPRLELLGYTLDCAQDAYVAAREQWQEERIYLYEDGNKEPPKLMDFSDFMSLINSYSVSGLKSEFLYGVDHKSELAIRSKFDDELLEKVPFYAEHDIQSYSERGFFIDLINILHPYFTLRLLNENQENADLPVTWQYGPLAEAGWAKHGDFVPGARRTDKILLVTEGTSDVHILQHALKILKPGVEDFFRFIDVSESHPFSGTGNLVRFAEGLAKIDIQNKVLFVLDNDAEGLEAHQKICSLSLPDNVRSMVLPEILEFSSFPTIGPEGIQNANINGRAASIECYLDLNTGRYPAPKVRWTNYKKSLDIYQGSLEYKDTYTKEFLQKDSNSISSSAYDVAKILKLLEVLISECTSISAAAP